ncbi:uncharacterized protein LOC126359744 isoform X2 [Schistocerca gregaria]|uniref:uncharacterized protein LOC126359744 isoform X2 n=1 Tax=Schistocerca gregaria TaxID=7010 RepID=UPI00211EE7EB|nr:uncharacterized protein LOC126359744 isoform X2 [Schistocerca gregaria]
MSIRNNSASCEQYPDMQCQVSSTMPSTSFSQDGVGQRVLRASFRGRPLVGDKLELPKQYSGIVMQEQKQPLTESTERTAHVTHAFKSIVYWNWAKQPSKNDAFISMLDWIDIAEVLHTSD